MKRTAFFIAPFVFMLDLSTYFIPGSHLNSPMFHVLLHYVVIFSLIGIIGSRDKLDDELSRQIRYSVFKQSLFIMVASLAITSLLLSRFYDSIPLIVIVYIVEGILILHIILYHIGVKYSPKWLLQEIEVSKDFSKAARRLLIVLTIVVILLFAILVLEQNEILS